VSNDERADGNPRTREQVMALCAELPFAVLEFPFGDDTGVYKLRNKIFALITMGDAPARVSLKCDPWHAEALVREYAAITPGYHLNKKHWITIDLDPVVADALPDGLVADLIESSYELIAAKLPVALRPWR